MTSEIVRRDEGDGAHASDASWDPSCAAASVETMFVVELAGDADAVAILRQLVSSGQVVARRRCWSRSFDDGEEARLCFDWLSSDPERVILLAATATTIGTGLVDGMISAGVASYAEGLAEAERKAAAERDRIQAKEAEERRRAERISVYFEDQKGRASLTMQRGSDDVPFWTISFDHKWERSRFWDWLRWQEGRFRDFAQVAHGGEPGDLKRMLLREMLAAEQTARANGQTVSGQRPLRFWPGEL